VITALRKSLSQYSICVILSSILLAQTAANAAQGESSNPSHIGDTSSLESVVDASLQALSGPAGKARDWNRYRALFDPAAQLIPASVNEKGEIKVTRWTLNTYQEDANDYLVKTGFEDRKLACLPTRFGNVATVRCSFVGLEGRKAVERGVALYQLYHDGTRWWISSVAWDQERPGNPIPSELLPK
jgi:hypothetical protein